MQAYIRTTGGIRERKESLATVASSGFSCSESFLSLVSVGNQRSLLLLHSTHVLTGFHNTAEDAPKKEEGKTARGTSTSGTSLHGHLHEKEVSRVCDEEAPRTKRTTGKRSDVNGVETSCTISRLRIEERLAQQQVQPDSLSSLSEREQRSWLCLGKPISTENLLPLTCS